jgi:hypothetical protein
LSAAAAAVEQNQWLSAAPPFITVSRISETTEAMSDRYVENERMISAVDEGLNGMK